MPEDVVSGTSRPATASSCGSRAGRRRRAARARSACSRAGGIHREVFRDRARPARPRLRGRDVRLARPGPCRRARCATRARAMCAISPSIRSISKTFINEVVLPDCPPPVFALAHSMGATVLLRAAFAGKRWFDRMVLLAPMIELPGAPLPVGTRMRSGRMRLMGLGAPLCPGRRRIGDDAASLHGQPAHLRSGPLCPQRRGARGRPALAIGWPTVAWTDSAFKVMGEISERGYPGRHPPADPDHRRRSGRDRLDRPRSTSSRCACAPAPTHRAGLAPRAADGAGSLSLQGPGGVRRFRSCPGSAVSSVAAGSPSTPGLVSRSSA